MEHRNMPPNILCKLFIVLLSVLFLFSTGEAIQKIPIAVLDLEAKGNASISTAEALTSIMQNDLFNTDRFDIAERNRVEQIMKEHSLQMAGYTDSNKAIELGKKLNVEKIVTGELNQIGEKYIITIRLIDVMMGKVEKADKEECKCPEEELTDLIEQLSQRIANAIPLRGAVIQIKGDDIYTDLGTNNGISDNMIMTVIRRGDPIKDLEGNIIGIEEEEIGLIEIKKAQPSFSIGNVIGTPEKKLQKGDWITGKITQDTTTTQTRKEEKTDERKEEKQETKREDKEDQKKDKDKDDESDYSPPPTF